MYFGKEEQWACLVGSRDRTANVMWNCNFIVSHSTECYGKQRQPGKPRQTVIGSVEATIK